jgi:hypothetical protein
LARLGCVAYSKVALTSSALNVAPLWKVTPSRNTYSTVYSSMSFMPVASSQTICVGLSVRIGVRNNWPKTKLSKFACPSEVWLVVSQLPVTGSAEANTIVLRPAADARLMKGVGNAVAATPPAAAVSNERLVISTI